MSYSRASASPTGLSDVLLPATAAAILCGVSLSGGTGRPIGIAMGAMTLLVLHAGLNGLGASPAVHDILTGAILLTVALSDGADTTAGSAGCIGNSNLATLTMRERLSFLTLRQAACSICRQASLWQQVQERRVHS